MNKQKLIYGAIGLVMAIGTSLGIYFAVIAYQKSVYASIKNFDDCVAAGYPIMESYPEQCATPDGKTFVRSVNGPNPSAPSLSEKAAAAVRTRAALDLGTAAESITIVNFTETTWPDGCLGLREKDEGCIQIILPGYRVQVAASGKEASYRVSYDGSIVRAEK